MSVNLYAEQERGTRARMLLESDAYKDAVGEVRAGIIKKWQECPLRDTEGQHELKLMLKLLNDLEANIARAADTGKLASIQIEREQEEKKGISKLFNWR